MFPGLNRQNWHKYKEIFINSMFFRTMMSNLLKILEYSKIARIFFGVIGGSRYRIKNDFMFEKWKLHVMNKFDYQKKLEIIKTSGIMIAIHLTDHCNLNCKGCSHFSPLADEKFMKTEVFEADMERMSQLFCRNEIWRIKLLGGEPLLHPQVNDFMKIAAKYFPNTELRLVTNGLLLPAMTQSFWETCRTTGTSIDVSRYNVGLNYSGLKKKARTEGVELNIYPKKINKYFHKYIYDLSGMQNERLSHSTCGSLGNSCQLNNGRFYSCIQSANFHHFNRFFNLGISLSDDNFVDIYKAKSKDEFYKLLLAPAPCCRYCNVKAREFGVKWERSKRTLDEWTYSKNR